MVHLNLKFSKHQIYFSILTKYAENFIGIKKVWPKTQPPRQSEVKFKILTPIDHRFTWSDATFFSLCQWNWWLLKSCSCSKKFSKLIPTISQISWGYLSQTSATQTISFSNIDSHENKATTCVNFEFDLRLPWRLWLRLYFFDCNEIFRTFE